MRNSARYLPWGVLSVFLAFWASPASAACTIPNTLTNGTPTDATDVMGNFNALNTCVNGVGSVNAGTAGQVGTYSSSGSQISGQSLSNILDSSISSTRGAIIYRGASGWQALTPGTSGQILSSNGSGADPSWIAPSSGGGLAGAFPDGTSGYSISYSAVMNVVHVTNTIYVSELAALFSPVSGATYKMGIAGWDSVNSEITAAPSYTGSQTVTTGGSTLPVYFSFGSPVTVPAGDYAVMIIRTDATTTTSMGLLYGSTFWAPRLYMTNSNTAYSLTSQAPTTSDVWTSQGSGVWNFALSYTY